MLSMAATARDKEKEPKEGKEKNIFVFKADRKLVGGRVEILRENGAVLSEQILRKRKMIIDFEDVKDGEYTIRVIKGEKVQEFTFEKK